MSTVGACGVAAKGWGNGVENTDGYAPRGVASNEVSFAVIADERGLIGITGFVLLYGTVIATGLRTASHCRDRLGRIVAVGIVTMLF